MPLTPFQREVAHILAANRNPESLIGGGAAINRADTSLRYSEDLDIFNDFSNEAAASVVLSAEADERSLLSKGCGVRWALRNEGHFRAIVTRGEEKLRLDWAADSAFRFFPAQQDPDFGYCLHPADLATNKALALASRAVIRDFLDILSIDKEYLNLGAVVWAACGKDQGYSPNMLLNDADRHTSYRDADLQAQNLAKPVKLRDLKLQWITAKERAERLFTKLPQEQIGHLYLDKQNNPVTPDPDSPEFSTLRLHYGSIRGAWPSIS